MIIVEVMNRFKGLDLVDRELWMEVCNTVQEAVTITIPNKMKCKKAKWLSEFREEKRNAQEKGKDTYLNAEYQRTAR